MSSYDAAAGSRLAGPNVERGEIKMTLRMDLACTALAAVVLILTGVTTAPAAVQTSDSAVREATGHRIPDVTGTPRTRVAQSGNCIGGPWRCHYGAEGRLHWGSVSNGNRVAWGCGATDGRARGRSWSFPNRAAASYGALAACNRSSVQKTCRLISCRTSVHSSYEAQAIWGPGAHR